MADTSELAAVVLLTTMPNEQSAETLATRLVDERMIACANLVPGVRSIYRWNGEIRDEGEVLVVM
jgi:periplasmic divalent cation tolerance protein